jgi:outer membrane protein OmpA-like peptidoglycan-associated protein
LLNRTSRTIGEFGATRIAVEGHTDTTGTPAKNKRLSERRAEVVKKYLMGAVAKDGSVAITARGVGADRPIAANNTKQGRAQNRRVDLILSPQEQTSPKSNQAEPVPAF